MDLLQYSNISPPRSPMSSCTPILIFLIHVSFRGVECVCIVVDGGLERREALWFGRFLGVFRHAVQQRNDSFPLLMFEFGLSDGVLRQQSPRPVTVFIASTHITPEVDESLCDLRGSESTGVVERSVQERVARVALIQPNKIRMLGKHVKNGWVALPSSPVSRRHLGVVKRIDATAATEKLLYLVDIAESCCIDDIFAFRPKHCQQRRLASRPMQRVLHQDIKRNESIFRLYFEWRSMFDEQFDAFGTVGCTRDVKGGQTSAALIHHCH
mmetsp:Transcript_29736/g.52187  ORF Transcript_29736/g.52187 Transcript_29736/m.52187 type:complete len:269 (-) Transcript_29736:268-1074(-)